MTSLVLRDLILESFTPSVNAPLVCYLVKLYVKSMKLRTNIPISTKLGMRTKGEII